MSLSQAANLVEKALGHGDNATTEQDITNPDRDRQKYADPSGEMMKALVWMSPNNVQISACAHPDSHATIPCCDIRSADAFVSYSRLSQAQSRGGPRCNTEGDWKHHLRL